METSVPCLKNKELQYHKESTTPYKSRKYIILPNAKFYIKIKEIAYDSFFVLCYL